MHPDSSDVQFHHKWGGRRSSVRPQNRCRSPFLHFKRHLTIRRHILKFSSITKLIRSHGLTDRCRCVHEVNWGQSLNELLLTLFTLRENTLIRLKKASWKASISSGVCWCFCCFGPCYFLLMPLALRAQNEEELEEAREEEEVAAAAGIRRGGFTASNMASAATPSSCRSWMDARAEDRRHRLTSTVALVAGRVWCREIRRQPTVSGRLRGCSTCRARWRTTRSGYRR